MSEAQPISLPNNTSNNAEGRRRSIIKKGAKLAYSTPLIVASFRLQGGSKGFVSPTTPESSQASKEESNLESAPINNASVIFDDSQVESPAKADRRIVKGVDLLVYQAPIIVASMLLKHRGDTHKVSESKFIGNPDLTRSSTTIPQRPTFFISPVK